MKKTGSIKIQPIDQPLWKPINTLSFPDGSSTPFFSRTSLDKPRTISRARLYGIDTAKQIMEMQDNNPTTEPTDEPQSPTT